MTIFQLNKTLNLRSMHRQKSSYQYLSSFLTHKFLQNMGEEECSTFDMANTRQKKILTVLTLEKLVSQYKDNPNFLHALVNEVDCLLDIELHDEGSFLTLYQRDVRRCLGIRYPNGDFVEVRGFFLLLKRLSEFAIHKATSETP